MVTKTETRDGNCATHGQVPATRQMPGAGFPFIVYAVRRYRARNTPYVCPTCGQPVDSSATT